MKWIRYVGCLLLVLLLSIGGLQGPRSHRETEFLMDTVVSVTAYGNGAKAAVKKAFLRLREIDKKCNAHSADSELAKLNQAPKNTPVALDREVYMLIRTAYDFAETAEGLFDITLLPVSTLWGFGTDRAAVPRAADLQAALCLTGYEQLRLADSTQTVTKLQDGVQLDLGGLAKGYAADEALRVLKEAGIRHAFLDLGGNVAVMGGKPLNLWERLFSAQKTEPFTIGLQQPDAPRGTIAETITLADGFVVTSGDYERYFEENGRRYHHILKPQTGRPAESDIASVTVVTQKGLTADMLSTALFVAGEKDMPQLYALCDAIITIDKQGQLHHVK